MVKAASLRRRHRARTSEGPQRPARAGPPAECPVVKEMERRQELLLRELPAWKGVGIDPAEYELERAGLRKDLANRIEKHKRACGTCRTGLGPLDVAFGAGA